MEKKAFIEKKDEIYEQIKFNIDELEKNKEHFLNGEKNIFEKVVEDHKIHLDFFNHNIKEKFLSLIEKWLNEVSEVVDNLILLAEFKKLKVSYAS